MDCESNRGERKQSQRFDSAVAWICYELNVIILSRWIETIIQSFCWEFVIGVQGGNGIVCLWKNTVIRSRSWYHWVWHCDMESSSNQLGMSAASSCRCTFACIFFCSFCFIHCSCQLSLTPPFSITVFVGSLCKCSLAAVWQVSCSLTSVELYLLFFHQFILNDEKWKLYCVTSFHIWLDFLLSLLLRTKFAVLTVGWCTRGLYT